MQKRYDLTGWRAALGGQVSFPAKRPRTVTVELLSPAKVRVVAAHGPMLIPLGWCDGYEAFKFTMSRDTTLHLVNEDGTEATGCFYWSIDGLAAHREDPSAVSFTRVEVRAPVSPEFREMQRAMMTNYNRVMGDMARELDNRHKAMTREFTNAVKQAADARGKGDTAPAAERAADTAESGATVAASAAAAAAKPDAKTKGKGGGD